MPQHGFRIHCNIIKGDSLNSPSYSNSVIKYILTERIVCIKLVSSTMETQHKIALNLGNCVGLVKLWILE